jgi:hypothetical protein
MLTKVFSTVFCLLLSLPLFSQKPRKCLVTPHMLRMQNDPDAIARRQEMERATATWIANNQGRLAQNRNAVITIPVVVHVVYRTAVQNISDAQIQSQIAVLNKDFRKLNTDIGSVPSVCNLWRLTLRFSFASPPVHQRVPQQMASLEL